MAGRMLPGGLQRKSDRIAELYFDFTDVAFHVANTDVMDPKFWARYRSELHVGTEITCRFGDGRPDVLLRIRDDVGELAIDRMGEVEPAIESSGREHLIICVEAAGAPHQWCLVKALGKVGAKVSSGTLGTLVANLVRPIMGDPHQKIKARHASEWPDLTITTFDSETVLGCLAELTNPKMLCVIWPGVDITVLVPEGSISPDRWTHVRRQGGQLYDLKLRFKQQALGEAVLKQFGADADAINVRRANFEEFVGHARNGRHKTVMVRPTWLAVELVPEAFAPQTVAQDAAPAVPGLSGPLSHQEWVRAQFLLKNSARALPNDRAAKVLSEAFGKSINATDVAKLRNKIKEHDRLREQRDPKGRQAEPSVSSWRPEA